MCFNAPTAVCRLTTSDECGEFQIILCGISVKTRHIDNIGDFYKNRVRKLRLWSLITRTRVGKQIAFWVVYVSFIATNMVFMCLFQFENELITQMDVQVEGGQGDEQYIELFYIT